MLNPLSYGVEYKHKLSNSRTGRGSHYKQVSLIGEAWLRLQGKKIVRRYNR